ncbi:hypothetical protein, variant 9 [Aphanomyces astaci]|uniref:Uncharacterized protein n=1 Tax=Aphanomyces astaci TaxID=112090 RepID=W4FMH5_APHAT|nr:hypothetical protein, variant 9 [Aphanomyces astaci]ETV68029.1 hypothetical protein, variant 9 [Aphanomyces astaci]|eukprot:XP_009842590.1 hypothetical protein, variant 9 [Aphanomyces astaci]
MAAVGPSKSRALYYEMQLREALLASDNVHALFDKERRVQRCIRLADELCGDLTVFGPILHTILVELKAAIFRCSVVVMSNCHVETGGADSDESLARGFFGCGVFSDTATVADIQARTSYREIPCFVLLDVAYRERTSVLQAKAEFQSLQEHALAKHTNVLVNERLLRKEVNITMGELADTQAQVARSKLAFESLQMEAKQQRRDMASSTLYLQREMQAMSVAITQYQAQIRELQRERATSDSVRKDFESVRLMASASPPSTHDAATKELLQTLQTDMQLLLLRNARLREYDSDIIRCSPDMRHKFRQDFVHDIGSLLNEHAVLEAYVKEQEAAIGDVASTIQVPHRTLLVHNPPVPDTVLWAPFVKWHPEPIPKCIPTWTVGDLDVLFTQLWVKIAMVERKWVRWTLEHERDVSVHTVEAWKYDSVMLKLLCVDCNQSL